MATKAPEQPHVDPVPPLTGWAKARKHVVDWSTAYFWVPGTLFVIWLFAKVAYFLTGREPQENADWIVGLAGNLVKCVFVILMVELCRERTGHWYTKQEMMQYPNLVWTQTFSKCFTLVVFAWLVSH